MASLSTPTPRALEEGRDVSDSIDNPDRGQPVLMGVEAARSASPAPRTRSHQKWLGLQSVVRRKSFATEHRAHQLQQYQQSTQLSQSSFMMRRTGSRISSIAFESDAELGANLVFGGYSAVKTQQFRLARLLPELHAFRESAAEKHICQGDESIPGICWGNGKIETFDLRPEELLGSTIHEDSHTQRAKVLFDVAVAVPVMDLVYEDTIVAVLVFYRLSGDEAERPGRFLVKDNLASLLYHAATIAPKALKLQSAQHAFQQVAFPECRAQREADAAQEEEAAAAGEAAMRAIYPQKSSI
jgi:hypothetical protein